MIKINTTESNFLDAMKLHCDNLHDKIIDQIKAYEEVYAHLSSSSGKTISFKKFNTTIQLGEKERVVFYKFLRQIYNSSKKKSVIKLHNDLLQIIKSSIKDILIGTPSRLELIIGKIQAKSMGHDVNKIKMNGLPEWKKLYMPFIISMRDIFDYVAFSNVEQGWGAYQLADYLKVDVCPYCNRQYTLTIIEKIKHITPKLKKVVPKNKNLVRPEFDHFYCRTWFPYLALSFYNLVPSCHICNSNLKGSEKLSITTHLHPYVEGFEDDTHFKTGSTIKDFIDDGYKVKASIALTHASKISKDKAERSERNIELFALREIYIRHKEIAEEIFKSAVIHTDIILKGYLSISQLFDNDFDLYRLAFFNVQGTKNHHKRPLAKFTEDIAKETGYLKIIGKVVPKPK